MLGRICECTNVQIRLCTQLSFTISTSNIYFVNSFFFAYLPFLKVPIIVNGGVGSAPRQGVISSEPKKYSNEKGETLSKLPHCSGSRAYWFFCNDCLIRDHIRSLNSEGVGGHHLRVRQMQGRKWNFQEYIIIATIFLLYTIYKTFLLNIPKNQRWRSEVQYSTENL